MYFSIPTGKALDSHDSPKLQSAFCRICIAGAGLVAIPAILEGSVAANAYYALGMRHGVLPEAVPQYPKNQWVILPTFIAGLLTLGSGLILAIRELSQRPE